jgi:ABC-type Mn2+/Zn2+ transport system permease subunit
VHSGAHLAELQNLFTGLDVAVAPAEAAVAAPLLSLTLAPTFLLWRRWLLLAQAPRAAQIAGIHPARWHLLFLGTLSAIVLISTDVLGIVLVIAMLFLPAAAALPWAGRLPTTMALAVGLGLMSLAGGFVLSTEMDWPLSQSAAAAGLILVVLSYAGRGARSAWRRSRCGRFT